MNNWWKNYFAEAWPTLYATAKTAEETALEVDFIEELIANHDLDGRLYFNPRLAGISLLDVPCGYGRMSLELAERGYKVCAFDYDKKALDSLQQKANDKRIILDLEQGDMRAMTFEKRFDWVLCPFNSFGYFADRENENFLKSAHRALKKRGSLLLNMHILESLLVHITPQAFWQVKDANGLTISVLEQRYFEHKTSRLESTWTVLRPQMEAQIFETSTRIYSYLELVTLLEKVGFEVINAFGDFTGKGFELGDEEVILLMRKC